MRSPIIDLHEYLQLELTDQLICLQNNGVQISTVKNKVMRQDLYALGDFYVEVKMSYENGCEQIKDLLPFIKGPRLDKYLETIDINGLVVRSE